MEVVVDVEVELGASVQADFTNIECSGRGLVDDIEHNVLVNLVCDNVMALAALAALDELSDFFLILNLL